MGILMQVKVFFLFLIFSAISFINGQWKEYGSPNCGYVICMTHQGSRLFAGTANGLYISTDGGAAWKKNSGLLKDKQINNLAAGEKYIYAAADYYIYISSDGGETWEQKSPIISCYALKTSGKKTYAFDTYGLYWVNQGEDNWHYAAFDGFRGSYDIKMLICDTVVVMGSYGKLRYSSGDFKIWKEMSVQTYYYDLAACGPYIFLAGQNGLYRGILGVTDFEKVFSVNCYSVMSVGTNLYIMANGSVSGGWYDGLYMSSDFGGSWVAGGKQKSNSLLLDSYDGRCFISSSIGCFSSKEGESAWKLSGPQNCSVYEIVKYDNSLLAAVNAGGVFKTNDGGKTWEGSASIPEYNAHCLLVNNEMIYAGTTRGPLMLNKWNGVWTSNNGWFCGSDTRTLYAVDGNLFTGQSCGFYKSALGENYWSKIDDFNYLSIFKICGDGNNIFVGTSAGLFYSPDKGTSWRQIGFTGNVIQAAAISGSRVICAANSGEVFFSSDLGSSWQMINRGEFHSIVNSLFFYDKYILAATEEEGIFVLSDVEKGWKSAGFEGCPVKTVTVINDTIFAGTSFNGIFYMPVSNITGVDSSENGAAPVSFTVEQNFPNPFNAGTSINFSLPKESDVEIQIFNSLGQIVKSAAMGKLHAGGHKYNFSPSSLPSGIYVYRVKSGGESVAKKMILMK
jgi:photosystem II stability/assembly factor-like uncharacterized protein